MGGSNDETGASWPFGRNRGCAFRAGTACGLWRRKRRREQHARTHLYACAVSGTVTCAVSHADAYSHSVAHSDAVAYSVSDSFAYPHPDSVTYSDADPNADPHADAHSRADRLCGAARTGRYDRLQDHRI